jgi:serine/threonine protein kinase
MADENRILNSRYRLMERIGAGGMSVVYKAQDLALGRLVAIKVLHESLTGDSAFLERFRKEARAAASLSHPNVVTVHDVGQDGDRHYIVMELVEGDDLKAIIRRWAPLPLEKALDLTVQICQGVGYAHRAGFVHCDVKPQNVLVTSGGRAMVADFGIARVISEATMSRSDLHWGTPHYFSPEQAAGEPATPSSDVYAIGVMRFEMLTGRLPFEAEAPAALALMHIRDDPPLVTDLRPSVPTPVAKIVQKVLAKEPSARYRTAEQLGRILKSFYRESAQLTRAMPAQPAQPVQPAQQITPQAAARPRPAPVQPAVQPRPPSIAAVTPRRPEETADLGPDWLAIFLGAIALLAILGLIPLWAFVYQAYSKPAPLPEIVPFVLFAIRSFSGMIK